MLTTKHIMRNVRDGAHANFILESINWRLKDFKKENGRDAEGDEFSAIVRTGFIMNHCFILEEINARFANELIEELYLK